MLAALRRTIEWTGQYAYCFLHHNPNLRDELFTTSYVVPQPLLAAIRVVVFVYCLSVLVANLVVNIMHEAGWSWPAYFTTLTYLGITMYYGFAAFNTCQYTLVYGLHNHRRMHTSMVSHPIQIPLEQFRQRTLGLGIDHSSASPPELTPEPKGYAADATSQPQSPAGWPNSASVPATLAQPSSTLHQLALATQWLLYETFTCYAPLVSLIYWGFLYPSSGGFYERIDTWMGTSMHATNTALMLLEVLLFSRCPYRWTHFTVVISVLASYLVLVYFMVGVYDFYVYPFFDARFFGGYIAIICLLVVDIVGLVWVVLVMVHRWRDTKYPKWTQG
ncbi:hypothetical protein EC988_003312 [Linderina pennispora]|nr:hypothetical protein EC988_003312 [Linderina pennispora]